MIELSSYWSSGTLEREATIYIDGYETYLVYMYQSENLIEARPIVGHSQSYVEDCAENWVEGYGEFVAGGMDFNTVPDSCEQEWYNTIIELE